MHKRLRKPRSQALPACTNEKLLFRTVSDGKLGGAWERGYDLTTLGSSMDLELS